MAARLACILFALSVASLATALDDVILAYPEVPQCEELIVPVLVYTLAGDGDYRSLANVIERETRIDFVQSAHLLQEPTPFVIFVDLIQSHHGGLIGMDVTDSQGNVTWKGMARVPPFRERIHLERHVIPWEIPANQMDTVFPRSDVYRIRAFPRFLDDTPTECAFEAATSILVVAAHE